jgi:tetratricopeptide (TPR) repeat protein
VDKSLVQAERVLGQEVRYGMLETIRQYALERLAASGEADTIRRQHAAHYLALAEDACEWIGRREQSVWLDRLDLEHDNLRAALGWALGGGAVEVGARIALALAGQHWSSFWDARGHGSEALRWLERVVEQSNQLTPAQRAWALLRADSFREGLNGIAWDQRFAVSDQALALFRDAGDRAGIAWIIEHRGSYASFSGDYVQATQLLEEALVLYQQIDQHEGIASTLHGLGDVARDTGDAARASQLLGESLAVCQAEGYVEEATLVLCGMGDVICIQGDFPRATARYWESFRWFEDEQHYSGTRNYALRNLGFMVLLQGADERVLAVLQQAVAWYREKGNQVGLGLLTDMLGAVLYNAGQAEAGLAILHEALTLQMQLGQIYLVLEIIELLAGIALGQGQTVQAARLLAAASALRRVHRQPGYPAARSYSDHILAAARAQLSADAFAAAWAAGQAMTLAQAIAEALGAV